MKAFTAVSFLLATCFAGSAGAQGFVKIVAPNGAPVAVPVIVTPGLGDIARGGNGRVMVDPSLMQMPYPFQQMVFAHEAAHAIGIMDETAADCFAGRMLRLAGFGPMQMQVVFNSMGAFLGPWGDATHLPSPGRIQVVSGCYSGQL